jgi:hypothetical protein
MRLGSSARGVRRLYPSIKFGSVSSPSGLSPQPHHQCASVRTFASSLATMIADNQRARIYMAQVSRPPGVHVNHLHHLPRLWQSGKGDVRRASRRRDRAPDVWTVVRSWHRPAVAACSVRPTTDAGLRAELDPDWHGRDSPSRPQQLRSGKPAQSRRSFPGTLCLNVRFELSRLPPSGIGQDHLRRKRV